MKPITVRNLLKTLRQRGCEEVRQEGSHLIVRCGKCPAVLVIHGKEVAPRHAAQHTGHAGAVSREGMDQMRTYIVLAERDEAGWWAVRIPELPGVLTQARRLDQVEPHAREAIDLAVRVGHAPAAEYSMQIEAHVPGLDDDLASVRGLRADADRLQAEAGERTRALARRLAQKGLTVRDIGAALGLSHQRAAQLVSTRSASTPGLAAKKVTKRATRTGAPKRRVKLRGASPT